MPPKEDQTYFGYIEGHPTKLLRLGSLVFDYANPRRRKPYFHKDLVLLGDPPLATKDKRPVCSLGRTENGSVSLGFSAKKFLDFKHSRSRSEYSLVVGKDGSKVELIDPDSFFYEHVLEEEASRLWLQTTLTLANKLHVKYKNAFRVPSIWMLTGIYTMNDAITYSVHSKSTSTSASATIPVPEPSMALLLDVAVGTTLTISNDLEGRAMSQIEGEKVWAAQWKKISAKFFVEQPDASTLKNRLTLLDEWSLETERSDDVMIVELDSKGGEYACVDGKDDDDGLKEFDEEVWTEFEKGVEELLAELEE